MALVKVRELLEAAQKANTSIIAFDACDYNTIYACIKGAETARRPVIVMLYPSMRSMFSFGAFAAAVKDLARSATVPVGLHLDHCSEPTVILEAIRDGFTSVMADGSAMPFEENVAFTKSVVDMAKVFDVDVEGELGHVGQIAAGFDYTNRDTFTRPEEAAAFAANARRNGFGVLIDRVTDTPLVLHGGSGIPADQLEKAFTMGINKFNVGTEFFLLNARLTHEYHTERYESKPFADLAYIRKGLTDYIAQKLTLCTLSV